ncbi:hypothetical protein PSAB6_450147 [Paraburkholderia sabiae]|nr:hypothetical protein PSAB6_450147 [Paraburkholderia sabiae]
MSYTRLDGPSLKTSLAGYHQSSSCYRMAAKRNMKATSNNLVAASPSPSLAIATASDGRHSVLLPLCVRRS